MQWYEIYLLSVLEVLSLLYIWNKLNNRIGLYTVKSLFIMALLPTIVVIVDVYDVDIGFLINFILLCIMVIILFKISVKDTIFQFSIVFITVSTIQFVFTYLLTWFSDGIYYSLANGLIVNTATLASCMLVHKYSTLSKIHKYLHRYGNYVITISLNIAGIILLLMYMWQIDKDFVEKHILYLVFAVILWEGLNIFFLYQSILIHQQQKIIYIHEKYIPYLKNMVNEVREKQHDFKNHLNALYGMVQMEDDRQAKKEMKQYIESLIEGIKGTDRLLNIKDPVLSAIIYSKKSLAAEKGILFEIEFQGPIPEYPLEQHELVELLGNLLDNAIEAVENKDVNGPKVVLILGTEENSSVIEVRNTGGAIPQKDIDRIFERGFSTKKGKSRGYGLYNVKRIIDRYKGTIELSFDGMYTVFRILL
ncbi:sensor histidine kinase [Geosporobacter ferrireducens]|uniref:Histidine kinase n=1 Tax=Geosporobacter ferrireducens TaxID=1424294 RepID=A0A1D8GJ27_9FIRM|nr:ATP-binding protein [Geosporobacter ferrireducens]AOT70921.1 histidine kinase [Geosporobacter ferrireducens]MTI53627.1 GHKL domain-containing protein [Geosporobacter ferrireducens]